MAEERVSLTEAATLLGIAPNSVRSRFKAGKLRGERDNKQRIWVWIDREGDDCILRVGLTYTTFFDDTLCGIFFELTLAVDESCQNRTALYSSGGGCCIDASAATATLTLF